MSGLSNDERESVRRWLYDYNGGKGGLSNLWPLVNQIATARADAAVRATLEAVDERCARAEGELAELARESSDIRLGGKRQGVSLVRDYIRAAIPRTSQPPAEHKPRK